MNKDRVVIGNVGKCPPEHAKKLIFYDRKTGDVVAVPTANRALTPEERQKREDAADARREAWEQLKTSRKARKEAQERARAESYKAKAAAIESKL